MKALLYVFIAALLCLFIAFKTKECAEDNSKLYKTLIGTYECVK